MNEVERSTLWQEAFTSRKNDTLRESRLRLMMSLQRMRENVSILLTMIPVDCKHLTIHDVSHLDALWELASLIVGPKYDINPAEVFVFGAAIFLHDAGLSTVAFPGGLNEVKSTQEWTDVSASTLREYGFEVDPTSILSPPNEILPKIVFSVLRLLHARQAERMATAAWQKPGGGEIYLIDDVELRQAFGGSIGRVAHSHHWDIEKVAGHLLDNVGTGTVLPNEWSVSERKAACLLRCADAAHIDRRRAPSLLYAALKPTGLSDLHWNAQNKINKPTVDKASLVYSSGQSFKASESDAWWLAYDLAKVADRELRGSNALLDELKLAQLKVQRVLGVESPRSFSTYMRADGWKPVDAEIKVSDPVHLARTLGGRNLYGRDTLAPLRELLQNAADAVRARRLLEGRPDGWGLIRVTFEPNAADTTSCWLHVDDNGIGMSERVLSGPLIDFGKSIGTSSILQEEFPGLQSKNIKPIGKFGIGFFSIFELGDEVKVVSKRFEDGLGDTRVLEFRTIASRPIIRSADVKELPRDASTRVSVKIIDLSKIDSLEGDPRWTLRLSKPGRSNVAIADAVLKMISMLDIKVEFSDRLHSRDFEHQAEVYDSEASMFFDEIMPDLTERDRETLKIAHESLLVPLEDQNGQRFGRAALRMSDEKQRQYDGVGNFVSVGGFTYVRGDGLGVPYIGVVEGKTEHASRDYAQSRVPAKVLAAWASKQATLIDRKKFLSSALMNAAQSIVRCGGDPGNLPFVFASGSLISYSRASSLIRESKLIIIPVQSTYNNNFQLVTHSILTSEYFEVPLLPNVIVLNQASSDLVREQIGYAIAKQGRTKLSKQDILSSSESLKEIFRMIEKIWFVDPLLVIKGMQIFQEGMYFMPPAKWALCISRES